MVFCVVTVRVRQQQKSLMKKASGYLKQICVFFSIEFIFIFLPGSLAYTSSWTLLKEEGRTLFQTIYHSGYV